jgi:hypothetical protein
MADKWIGIFPRSFNSNEKKVWPNKDPKKKQAFFGPSITKQLL